MLNFILWIYKHLYFFFIIIEKGKSSSNFILLFVVVPSLLWHNIQSSEMNYFLAIALLVVLPDSCLLLQMLWHTHISFDDELDYFCDILLWLVTLSMVGAFYLQGCHFFHFVYDISLLTYFSPLFHQNPLSSVMTLSWKQKEYYLLTY